MNSNQDKTGTRSEQCHLGKGASGAALVALCVAPGPAHAYLDPGAASLSLQVIIAALAGGAITFRHWCARVRSLLGRDPPRNTDEDPSGENSGNDESTQ